MKWLLLCLLLAATSACRPSVDPDPPPAGAEIRLTPPNDPVSLHLSYRPDPIRLDRDTLAELTLLHAPELNVTLPALDDRIDGFAILDRFEEQDQPDAQRMRRVLHLRLRPMPDARQQRLAAMPLKVTTTLEPDAEARWIATTPHRFARVPLPLPGTIEPASDLLDIPPPWQTRLRRALPGLVALVLLSLGGWWLSRRTARPPVPLTPAELAWRELADLLARDDVGHHRYKDFYVDLTLIVRRYIERAHGLHAPEQTTPEFLTAAARHPAFPEPVLKRLRRFLEAADAIKFAAQPAERVAADAAVATARRYIETDAARPPATDRTEMSGDRS